MRRLPVLSIWIALALACAPAAHALPVDATPPVAPVFPIVGATGYGEWEARYGNFRHGHVHEGQDVFAPAGSPLLALRDAVVVEKGAGDGRGHYIALYSAAEQETYVYLHLQRPSRVDVGDTVAGGEPVGRVGCSGSCFGDHLHFEIRRGRGMTGKSADPLPLLRSLRRD